MDMGWSLFIVETSITNEACVGIRRRQTFLPVPPRANCLWVDAAFVAAFGEGGKAVSDRVYKSDSTESNVL